MRTFGNSDSVWAGFITRHRVLWDRGETFSSMLVNCTFGDGDIQGSLEMVLIGALGMCIMGFEALCAQGLGIG
jgi:hypothetical protein